MHELSLLENVRDILEQHARAERFTQVTQITLEIGTLSCIEPQALRFGFDVVMNGSLAEHAELVITELMGLGVCQNCREQVEMAHLYDPCSQCGHPLVTVTQGTEMKIKNLWVAG
jgi:hydrogenase nickel incorporation protein HypA/HybF